MSRGGRGSASGECQAAIRRRRVIAWRRKCPQMALLPGPRDFHGVLGLGEESAADVETWNGGKKM